MAVQMDSILEARSAINMQIARTAWTDDAFRRSFIADPKAEISKRLGLPLPDDLVVTVHEESPMHLHLVIPSKPEANSELSDEELENVAGGTATIFVAIGTLTAVTATAIAMSSVDAMKGGNGKFWNN